MLNILWRNMKWRFQNPISIILTILQPLIWLILYSTIAGQTMKGIAIDNYTAFILPGIMVLVIFSACSSGGIINYIMKTGGSFYRILIAPVSRSSIVLGQMSEAIILSFMEIAVLYIISFFFAVRVASGFTGILLIILLIFMAAFFMSGLAYTISLILPNEVIYETIMTAIVLPIFFLSTALFPPDSLSGGLALAVKLNPFTHIINALRSLIIGETVSLQSIIPVFVLFTVMCCGSLVLAISKLKSETAR